MNTQATLEQMQQLRLDGMAQSYEAILSLPLHQHPEAHQMVAQLVQHQKDWKRTKIGGPSSPAIEAIVDETKLKEYLIESINYSNESPETLYHTT